MKRRNSHVEPMMRGLINSLMSPYKPSSVVEHTLDDNTDVSKRKPLTQNDRERLRTAAKGLDEYFGQMSSRTGCDILDEATRVLVDGSFE